MKPPTTPAELERALRKSLLSSRVIVRWKKFKNDHGQCTYGKPHLIEIDPDTDLWLTAAHELIHANYRAYFEPWGRLGEVLVEALELVAEREINVTPERRELWRELVHKRAQEGD